MTMPDIPENRSAWLLLAHQPAYFRVKIWRRLQDLGAVAIKASLYALPSNADTREDFQWLLREIQEGRVVQFSLLLLNCYSFQYVTAMGRMRLRD
jgi:hypothetical protein